MASDADPKAKPAKASTVVQFLFGGIVIAGWNAFHKTDRPVPLANLTEPPAATVFNQSQLPPPPSPWASQDQPVPGVDSKTSNWLRPRPRLAFGTPRNQNFVLPVTPDSGGISPVQAQSIPATQPLPDPPVQVAPSASRTLTPPPEVALNITPAAEVDEQLFLLRALETLYQNWPSGQGNPQALQAAIDDVRHRAIRHQRYIQERKLDDRIAALYGDLIAMLDVYVDCLAQTGHIEREAATRVGRERTEAAARSSFSGGAAAAQVMNNGASGSEALVTWAGITVVGSLMSELTKAPARDEAKRQAIEANIRVFTTRYSEVMANAENAVLALSERYGWAPGEAGFDTTPDQMRQVMEISARNDDAALLRQLRLMQIRRPRDPFLRSVTAAGDAINRGDQATVDILTRAADECLSAVKLVPKGAFYDVYRKDFLAVAGVLANAATMKDQQEQGWVAGPAKRGGHDLSIWRTYLTLDPIDPSGEVREQLAYALAATGRFAEAMTTAGQVASLRRESGEFSYAYACLLSLTGQTAESLRWLEHAYRDCHVGDIQRAKSDPDLAAVRFGQLVGFGNLARVDFTWTIDWGFFDHDDIVLVNRSAFPLTGVNFDVEVTSSGSPPWSQTLTADRIEPGATQRWPTWVNARGNDWKGKAGLACDQRPK